MMEILAILSLLLSPIIDICLFLKLINANLRNSKNYKIYGLIFIIVVILEIISNLSNYYFSDSILTTIEMILLIVLNKKENIKVKANAALIVGTLDLLCNIFLTLLDLAFKLSISMENLINLLMLIMLFLLINRFSANINKYISNEFFYKTILYTLIYLYISSLVMYIISSEENHLSIGLVILAGILIGQGLYAMLILKINISTQRNIATKIEQKFLKDKNRQLNEYNKQLKNYADYLEKDEDKLQRFKHDYQNILNSLKLTAAENNSQQLLSKLDQYTQEYFDEKALSKFQDVNKIHDDLLKSIVITKLSRMHALKIPYRFSCENDIFEIPIRSEVEKMDFIRIIGISFDNAIEASQKLENAQINVMLYRDNDELEFVIRNQIKDNISKDILKKGYTTKDNHTGIGLNNTLEIVNKYSNDMIVDINADNHWFIFSLILLGGDKN